MKYAKRLTKERLIQEGFTEITKEGRLFKGEQEVFPRWNGKEGNPNRYLSIYLYKRDSEGHLVKGKDRVLNYTRKDGTVGESTTWNGISETFGLHRVMWAWHYGEVPEGFVVDHVNNKHSRLEDYHLDNLQLLTPKENITKERVCNIKETKCKMNKPRKFYEDKLKKYEELYESAKIIKDSKACHHLRANIANTRARLRYWDAHKEEYNEGDIKMKKVKTEFQKDLSELKEWKKIFKDQRKMKLWHQCCTIEKLVKEKGIEAEPIVKHALEVCHKHFMY